jgi:Ca-activated chloride channel family protein
MIDLFGEAMSMRYAHKFQGRVLRVFFFGSVVLAVSALLLGSTGSRRATAQQDGRARRTQSSQTPGQNPGAPALQKPTPTPVPGATPPALQTPGGDEIDEKDIVKVDTNLVSLNVRVIDRNNRPINDVRQDEFHIFENGVPQKIEFISKEEVPVSYGLAIDTSGSLRSQLPTVIDAGKAIINSNKEGDETFLVRFISSDKIETVQDFTSSKPNLLDAIDPLYTEGGQTAVIDAVYLSAERVSEYRKGDQSDRRRRALIVVTDGEDRVSYYKQNQLFDKLKEEDVQIFVIGFVNELDKDGGLIRKSPRDKAVSLLNRLATETGGRVFYPNSLSELPGIASEITRDLRTQYVVSYYPTNKDHDGTYRAIRVTVADEGSKEKRIAITRPGYTAKRAPATSAGTRKSD